MDHQHLSAPACAQIITPEPSDLEVAISVAQQLLDSDQILSVREAIRLLLRALGAEPQPAPRLTPQVLRLRMQMRAANYNPDHPNEVEALACVATVDTARLKAVLTGRAPLDWRIPRDSLAHVLGVDALGTGPDDHVRGAAKKVPAAKPVTEEEAVRRSVDAQFPAVAAFLAAERGEDQ